MRTHQSVALVVLLGVVASVAIVGRGDARIASTSGASARGAEAHVSNAAPSSLLDSIPSPAGPGSAEPNLTVGPDGRVYLSWLEPADSSHAFKFSVHDGRAWSAPRTIRIGRDFFVNWADFPSLAVMSDGRIVAHWLQRTGKGTYAYGVRMSGSRDGGATWSTAVVPHQDSSDTEHGFVSVWAEGANASAAWLDGRKFAKVDHAAGSHGNPANEMMLVAGGLDARGRRMPETTLDERACDCCQTAGAMTSTGPVIAYRDRSSDEIRDIYVVRRVGTKWTAPAPVYRDGWKIAACPVNGPSISARGARVALGWFTAANDSARVKLAFSTNGGASFGAPVRIDEGNPSGRVGTVLLADGSALVTWIERTGGDTASVRARRVDANGTRGAVMTIATSSAARASGFPRMALTGSHAMFAWTQPGRPSSVRTARVALSSFK
jgi:hypothetical protein